MTELNHCAVAFSDDRFCILDTDSGDDSGIQTPNAPRGKRSDISENDRELFVKSYKDLLDMLDSLETQNAVNAKILTE